MRIEAFIEPVKSVEFNSIATSSLEEIITFINNEKIERLYIVENKKPLFVINSTEIIDIFLNNKLHFTFYDFYNEKGCNIESIESTRHIIDTYNYLRNKRINFAPVIKDGNLIGEINFSTLSLKVSFIAIKDPLTNTYNQKYFDVLIKEYNEIALEIGLIMIKIYNLSIFEGLYGYDFKKDVLKEYAKIIKNSIRDVDFVFRNEDIFKIITFNSDEIAIKIKDRIEKKLNETEINGIQVPFKVVATHVPGLESNILIAVEELERKLVKRN